MIKYVGSEMIVMAYIIGQVLGIIAVFLGFLNYQVKTRERVLFVHTATLICFVVHYMLIGAYAGMAMNAVGLIRNIIFYSVGKKGRVHPVLAAFFALVVGVMGIINWEAWYSVFCLFGLIINSYALSFSKPENLRKSILITSPLVLIYDVFARSYGGVAYETVAIVSAVIGLIRFKKGNK